MSITVVTPSGLAGAPRASGFPTRMAGEQPVANYQELAVALASATAPAGSKPLVLAEVWDKPGVLSRLWIACAAGAVTGDQAFPEAGGTIRIYIDNDTTPAITCTLGQFFGYYPLGDVFSTPRLGRTSAAGQQTGAYRSLWAPFQSYLRVELENTTTGDAFAVYGVAQYSLVSNFGALGNAQLRYGQAQYSGTPAPNSIVTACDVTGSGQVESVLMNLKGASAADVGVLEGNLEFYLDGSTTPTIVSSGTEDFFNGGWYAVPIGGWPAGRAGTSTSTGYATSLYRFFLNDPIFFNSRLRVLYSVGQPGQGSITSSTVRTDVQVGYWLDSPATPSYTSMNATATALFTPPTITGTALPSFLTNAAGTWAASSGKIVQTDITAADARVGVNTYTASTAFWTEATVQITDATHNQQEAFLFAAPSISANYTGNRVSAELTRVGNANQWQVKARNGFDTPGVVNIGSGRDLTNVAVDLALKVNGTAVSVYWRLNGDTQWHTVCRWTTAVGTLTNVGIGSWTAAISATAPIVRPLHS